MGLKTLDMEQWYIDLLEDLEEHGEDKLYDAIQDGMYSEEARIILSGRADVVTWSNYITLLKLFQNAY